MLCTSCRINLQTEDNFARFFCPACSRAELLRCEQCRKRSTPYVCPSCGFKGP